MSGGNIARRLVASTLVDMHASLARIGRCGETHLPVECRNSAETVRKIFDLDSTSGLVVAVDNLNISGKK